MVGQAGARVLPGDLGVVVQAERHQRVGPDLLTGEQREDLAAIIRASRVRRETERLLAPDVTRRAGALASPLSRD